MAGTTAVHISPIAIYFIALQPLIATLTLAYKMIVLSQEQSLDL
jgi:hypothetical protein